ncbi:hypothetical protein C0J52_20469 [Blattella germanica]|nr:hypothetical protein C0J52_20469 [Blattella germanica]
MFLLPDIMKAFELGEAGKVLVVKQNGKISAIGAKCTHYGAPLEKGALGEGRVRCPYHGACYNIATGDIEDYPGLDSLPCFQVEIKKDGGVKVRARKEDVKSRPAGLCCAETLRQEGFKGRVVLVCKEPNLPYDRIKLSKSLDISIEKVLLRPAEFYKDPRMEAAAFCVSKAKSVTVIGRDEVPFRPVLGEEIGARILKFFKEKGVEFKMNSGIESIIASSSESDKVGEVKLTTGETLPADIVILGVGATPNTNFLEASGLKLNQQGYVIVNNFLETNLKGVFAGGDIAFAPVLQTHASIGHWGLAHYHGRIAGLNMVGKKTELKSVPFFWTMLFGVGIRYAGYAPKFTDIVIEGSVEDMKFVAHYVQDGRVAAVATINWEPVAANYAEFLISGNQICEQDLQPDPLAWAKQLNHLVSA